jgi:hypothetical protein
MRREWLKNFFQILLPAILALSVTACVETNKVANTQHQTNAANRFPANSADNVGSLELGKNTNLTAQNEIGEKNDDLQIGETSKEPPTYNIKISKTGNVVLDNSTRKSLNLWFSIFADAGLEPFSEKNLKSEAAISFALHRLFPIDKPRAYNNEIHSQANRCGDENESYFRIDENEVQTVVTKYFQMKLENVEPLKNFCIAYEQGCYSYDCYASGDMGFVFAVAEKMKSLGNNEFQTDVKIFDALSLFDAYNSLPCQGGNSEKRIKEIDDLDTNGDYETLMRECPKWKTKLIRIMRAKFKLVNDEQLTHPVLLSYKTLYSCKACSAEYP